MQKGEVILQDIIKRTRVSSFALARINFLSSNELQNLILSKTIKIIKEYLTVSTELQTVKEQVQNILFNLVSELSEHREWRRKILKLKRDFFNERPINVSSEEFSPVFCYLLEEERVILEQALNLASLKNLLLLKAEQMYIEETNEVALHLRWIFQREEILKKGLLLASQDYIENLDVKDIKPWMPSSNYARTSVAYLTRAAMKTSPFSTITQLDYIDINNESKDIKNSKVNNRIFQPLITSWLHGMAKNEIYSDLFEYEINKTIIVKNNTIRWFKSIYSVQKNFPIKQETEVSISVDEFDGINIEWLCNSFKDRRFQKNELLSCIGDWSKFRHLLDLGIIIVKIPDSIVDKEVLLGFSKILLRKEETKRTAELYLEMHHIISEYSYYSFEDQLEKIGYLKKIGEDIFHHIGVEPPKWFSKLPIIYQDYRYGFENRPTLSSDILKELEHISREISKKIIYSHLYDEILTFFIQKFGKGGDCFNILEFVREFIEDYSIFQKIQTCLQKDKEEFEKEKIDRTPDKLQSASLINPAALLYYQICEVQEENKMKGEDFYVVINQIGEGNGNIFGRFLPLFENKGRNLLFDNLKKDIKLKCDNSKVLQVNYGEDWSNLQIIDEIFPTLDWPTDAANKSSIKLKDLKIKHDIKNNSLVILDQTGCSVIPVYMGTIPTFLLPLSLRIFLTISNPWINGYTADGAYNPFSSGKEEYSFEIENFCRETQGRHIIRRACWKIPYHLFPFKKKDEGEFNYLVRVQKWVNKYNIPEEAFVGLEKDVLREDTKQRKPFWVHFGSIHCLQAIQSYFKGASAKRIIITEVLPARNQQWIDQDKERHAVEFMSLCQWNFNNKRGNDIETR